MPNSQEDQDPFEPRSLPSVASDLCERLHAPPRLVAHLMLVHEAAVDIVAGLRDRFLKLTFDSDVVLFGAATHDLAKTVHPQEITGSGHEHEEDGPGLLQQHGVPPHLARFARTHAAWRSEPLPLEDLLVALADTVWKGKRIDDLEVQVTDRIAEQIEGERWEVYAQLDTLLEEVAKQGEQRLAWQAKH